MGKVTITIEMPEGANAQDIAAELRFQAGLLEGMPPVKAASKKNTTGFAEMEDALEASPEEREPIKASEADDKDDDDDDFGAKPAPKAKKAAAKKKDAFDDDGDDEEIVETAKDDDAPESDDDDDDDDDDEDFAAPAKAAAPKAKKAVKITIKDVNAACKAYSSAQPKDGFKKTKALLKKKFGVESINDLEESQFADVVKAMEV